MRKDLLRNPVALDFVSRTVKWFLAAALLLGGVTLLGQDDEPLEGTATPTFSLDVKVVNVLATVKDRQGRLISTLGKDDFVLAEDGTRQDIHYFAHQTDLPLTVGLLIDTSGSQRAIIPDEQSAGLLFFQSMLRPESDLAFLMSFDRNVELLQDYTSAVALLERGLNELHVEVPMGGLHPGPTGGRGNQTSTALYDAVFLAADEMFRNQVGRKAVVLISDGVDFGSKVSLKACIEAAQRAGVVVYSIQYQDRRYRPSAYMVGVAGAGPLKRMATETGGSFFSISRSRRLRDVFQQIEDEMRSQYSIGYTPKRELTGSAFRKLSLKTVRKGLNVQARNGYYPDAI